MQLTPVERDILVHLRRHLDDRVVNIAEKSGRHRGSVSRSAKNLADRGLIEDKGNATYRLTTDGLIAARDIEDSTGTDA